MEWLNYHHLLYFYVAAREGSISRAAAELRLAQPTISAQVKLLEETLGEQLFQRTGRSIVLTDVGRVVYRFAEEIFALGRELLDTVKDRPTGRPIRFTVGVADALPKRVVFRLLEPALALAEPVRLVCVEGKTEHLLAALAVHDVDLVLADVPLAHGLHVRAFNHLLGECGVSFLAARSLAQRLRRGFPRSLDGAPMLMPTEGTSLRRGLGQWFETQELRPQIASEFEDSALLKVFGQAGTGVFVVPRAIEGEVRRQYGVHLVGRTDDVQERFYAISAERRIKHPAVAAIAAAAKQNLFRGA